jgi:hypothetical protein
MIKLDMSITEGEGLLGSVGVHATRDTGNYFSVVLWCEFHENHQI